MPGETEAPTRLHVWVRRLAMFLGFALLGLTVYVCGWENLVEALQSARPLPLLAMAAVILAGLWLRAWKWHLVLGPGGEGVWFFFVAKLAGHWTPGRAGELAPLALTSKNRTGLGMWILADRVIEVSATLLLGLAGAASLGLVSHTSAVLLLLGGCVGLCAVLGVLARWPAPVVTRESDGRSRWRHLMATFIAELHTIRGKLSPILFLTALGKFTDLAAVSLLGAAFGYPVTLLLAAAARFAHALVSAIPLTPDISGVPFAAQGVLLHRFAGIPLATLAAALALEAVAIYALLYVSFIVAARRRPPGQAAPAAQSSR